jgi:hypothetical protein
MSTAFIKQANWVMRRIAGETILVPLAGNVADLDSIYVLDEVRSAVWDLLDGRSTPADIAEALCLAYDVRQDQATDDVTRLLEAMHDANLVSTLIADSAAVG